MIILVIMCQINIRESLEQFFNDYLGVKISSMHANIMAMLMA